MSAYHTGKSPHDGHTIPLLTHYLEALSKFGMVWAIYGILFFAIYLESILLLAVLLPGGDCWLEPWLQRYNDILVCAWTLFPTATLSRSMSCQAIIPFFQPCSNQARLSMNVLDP